MADTAFKNEPSLYDSDFHEWTRAQARAIAERRVADVDWANVAEEIESLGRSDKNEIRNRLTNVLLHLAKWEYQPEKRKYGWQASIREGRMRIMGSIDSSPSLKNYPEECLDWCWKHGRSKAALEMRRKVSTLPENCPYTVEQALDDAFWPGPDWDEDDIADEW